MIIIFRHTCSILVFATMLFSPFHVLTAHADADSLVKEMQQTYGALSSLSANFSQTITLPGRPGSKKGHGTAIFLRPSFMRWTYEAPDKQLFINDGSFLTIYQEKEKQMILAPVGSMDQDLTHLIFSGSAPLSDTFDIQSAPAQAMPSLKGKKMRVVQLVPKKTHNQVSVLYLAINANNLISAIRMKDHFETITVIRFTEIKKNSLDLSTPEKRRQTIMDLFSFTPPEGTEVIQQ